MRTEFDKEANAAYVYFKDIARGEVAETVELKESFLVDLDKNGKLLGIEILDASENLPDSLITELFNSP